MLRPDILQHNKQIMTEWLKQINEEEGKVFALVGITQEGTVKFLQIKDVPRDLMIRYMQHCTDMLKAGM